MFLTDAKTAPKANMKNSFPIFMAAVTLIASTWIVKPVLATTYYVSASSGSDANNGRSWDAPKLTIQAAIDISAQGDTVLVGDGTYNTGGKIATNYYWLYPTNRVCIDKAISVVSLHGPASTYIVGDSGTLQVYTNVSFGHTNIYTNTWKDAVRCVYMVENSFLSGFTISNGYAPPHISSVGDYPPMTITMSGGIFGYSGATVSNCLIMKNHGGWGYDDIGSGGGAFGVTLRNCSIMNNEAIGGGGGISQCTAYDCHIYSNHAQSGGGAHGSTLYRCEIYGNSVEANWLGGGVRWCTAYDCKIYGNSAHYGGGGFGSTLFNCVVNNNTANSGGGLCESFASNCLITGNVSDLLGGGIWLSGTYIDCIILNNSAPNGGGVCGESGGPWWYNPYQELSLYNCSIVSNSATTGGGVDGSSRWGGHQVQINRCYVQGNTATANGGGLYNAIASNTIIVANTAVRGGGSYLCELGNCTIVSNSAENAGGCFASVGKNCIVYYNSSTNGANYLEGELYNCCTIPSPSMNGNISNAPRFISAATMDFNLSSNSPCRDTGNNNYVQSSVDYAGNARIVHEAVDMGAYEYQGGTSADYDLDGLPNWWEVLYDLTPTVARYFVDTDIDGFKDLEEYIAGTSPRDSNSYLRASIELGVVPPRVVIDSVAGRIYKVQYLDNLDAIPQSWRTFIDNVSGNGDPIYIDDAEYRTNRFYNLTVRLAQ